MGKRSNLRDLPMATLSKVATLISADSFVYMNALQDFMDEMAWLESDDALGRRVVCDDVLKKWEPELAYIDNDRFNVTQMYRDAVVKLQQTSIGLSSLPLSFESRSRVVCVFMCACVCSVYLLIIGRAAFLLEL